MNMLNLESNDHREERKQLFQEQVIIDREAPREALLDNLEAVR